jgi:hypothetical protein
MLQNETPKGTHKLQIREDFIFYDLSEKSECRASSLNDALQSGL